MDTVSVRMMEKFWKWTLVMTVYNTVNVLKMSTKIYVYFVTKNFKGLVQMIFWLPFYSLRPVRGCQPQGQITEGLAWGNECDQTTSYLNRTLCFSK